MTIETQAGHLLLPAGVLGIALSSSWCLPKTGKPCFTHLQLQVLQVSPARSNFHFNIQFYWEFDSIFHLVLDNLSYLQENTHWVLQHCVGPKTQQLGALSVGSCGGWASEALLCIHWHWLPTDGHVKEQFNPDKDLWTGNLFETSNILCIADLGFRLFKITLKKAKNKKQK